MNEPLCKSKSNLRKVLDWFSSDDRAVSFKVIISKTGTMIIICSDLPAINCDSNLVVRKHRRYLLKVSLLLFPPELSFYIKISILKWIEVNYLHSQLIIINKLIKSQAVVSEI